MLTPAWRATGRSRLASFPHYFVFFRRFLVYAEVFSREIPRLWPATAAQTTIKFIYSERATKIWRNLQTFFDANTYLRNVKYDLEISSNLLAFSEYMSFNARRDDLPTYYHLIAFGNNFWSNFNLSKYSLWCDLKLYVLVVFRNEKSNFQYQLCIFFIFSNS